MSRRETEPESELPLSALEAERALICACLLEPGAIGKVERLQPDAFYRTNHQRIFESMLRLHRGGTPIDSVTLMEQMRRDETLELVGGAVAIASFYDLAGSSANAEAYASIISAQHARRRARIAARQLAEATKNGVPLDQAVGACVEALAAARLLEDPDARRSPDLIDQVLTDETIRSSDLSPAPDLIGSRYIVQGGLTILVGQSGLGKTFLAIQMMRSLALAEPWLGMPATQGRSGLLELEMPAWSIRERLRGSYGGRMDLLAMPEGFSRLTDRETLRQVIRWVRERELLMLVADPVHALHEADENQGSDLEPFMNALKELRSATGVHVVLIHHVNKLDFDKDLGLRMSVMRSVRGSGRLVNDPDNVLGLIHWHGRVLLVNAKTRFGPHPESMTIRQGEDGFFETSQSEADVVDVNRMKVEKALGFSDGATMGELMRWTQLTDKTISRYLKTLGAVRIKGGGDTRIWRWYPAGSGGAQEGFAEFQ